jgi:uncharacterized SAM-dependent methyltransferase
MTGAISRARKSLPAWLFYDATGSALFEQITELREYYLTSTERALLTKYSDQILELASTGKSVSISELGSGTAAKTGILLQAAIHRQERLFYQPIDVSQASLDTARENINQRIAGVTVLPQLSNYVTEQIQLERYAGKKGSCPLHRLEHRKLFEGRTHSNIAPPERCHGIGGRSVIGHGPRPRPTWKFRSAGLGAGH